MKKILFISITVLMLASCTTQKPLYSWGKYEITSYNYLKNSDEKSTQELIETYQNIIEKQKGSRGVVPQVFTPIMALCCFKLIKPKTEKQCC